MDDKEKFVLDCVRLTPRHKEWWPILFGESRIWPILACTMLSANANTGKMIAHVVLRLRRPFKSAAAFGRWQTGT
jgi:hypothetical protein